MKKRIIIGIHGLGNKAPKKTLEDWWVRSIEEGLNKYYSAVPGFNFELIYWADILHPDPLDPSETDNKSPLFIEEKYIPEDTSIKNNPKNYRGKAIDYLEKYYDKMMINGVLLMNNPSLTAMFVHRYLKDLEIYYSSETVRVNGKREIASDVIIERFIDTIKKHNNKKILLIAHSMGSIIVHDALSEYLPDLKIDTLITIGSPLAQQYVINQIKKEEQNKSILKLKTPENIFEHWYNLSDPDDQVAFDHKLAENYKQNSKNVKVKDIMVHNDYSVSGNRNPHKIYGYLRTRELTDIVHSFLTPRKVSLMEWLKSKFGI